MLTEQQLMEKGYHNRNYITGRYYRGEANQLSLNNAGFNSTEWMTFHQCKMNGWKIKPGSEGVLVIYREPVEKEEKDENGTRIVKSSSRVTKHIVFNLDQVEMVTNAIKRESSSSYNDQMITQKQRAFLIKLIESKYHDERTKTGLLNRVNELSKIEAKNAIQKILGKNPSRYIRI